MTIRNVSQAAVALTLALAGFICSRPAEALPQTDELTNCDLWGQWLPWIISEVDYSPASLAGCQLGEARRCKKLSQENDTQGCLVEVSSNNAGDVIGTSGAVLSTCPDSASVAANAESYFQDAFGVVFVDTPDCTLAKEHGTYCCSLTPTAAERAGTCELLEGGVEENPGDCCSAFPAAPDCERARLLEEAGRHVVQCTKPCSELVAVGNFPRRFEGNLIPRPEGIFHFDNGLGLCFHLEVPGLAAPVKTPVCHAEQVTQQFNLGRLERVTVDEDGNEFVDQLNFAELIEALEGNAELGVCE